MILVSGRACRLESSEIVDHLLKIKVEMFYLNTIEQLFLFVEQLDLLEVYLITDFNWNTNTGGIPKFKVEFK